MKVQFTTLYPVNTVNVKQVFNVLYNVFKNHPM